MSPLSSRQKTVGALLLGYVIAIAIDPFVTVVRLNVENWANANGYGAIYDWPVVASVGRFVMSIWDALTGSWGLGVICGMVALTFWEAIKGNQRPKISSPLTGEANPAPPVEKRYLPAGLSLGDLMKASSDMHHLEFRPIADKYIGLYTRAMGRFDKLSSVESGGVYINVRIALDGAGYDDFIICEISGDFSWALTLKKGDLIAVEGRIAHLGPGVLLDDCQLITDEQIAPA